MKLKYILLLSFFVGVICYSVYLNYDNINALMKPKSLVDCSKPPEIIYLKPDEFMMTHDILEGGVNRIVVIPESNEVRGKSEYLAKCDIDPYEYLNPEIKEAFFN